MKQAFVIILVSILFASGMKVSIDRHYCGGELADIKISLTGKMASCGMERVERDITKYPIFENRCCEDHIVFYSICSNYYPQYFSLYCPELKKDIPSHININSVFRAARSTDLISMAIPPGNTIKPSLILYKICVFRI